MIDMLYPLYPKRTPILGIKRQLIHLSSAHLVVAEILLYLLSVDRTRWLIFIELHYFLPEIEYFLIIQQLRRGGENIWNLFDPLRRKEHLGLESLSDVKDHPYL